MCGPYVRIGFTISGRFGLDSDGTGGWGYNDSYTSGIASDVLITGDIYNVAASGYRWAYNWTEGSIENGFADTYVTFFLLNESYGNDPAIIAGTMFDLPILERSRHISSYYGRPINYDGFTILAYLNSTGVIIEPVQLTASQAIGPQCPGINEPCECNGVCDYTTGTCICDDGYGSVKDIAKIGGVSNFPMDCSGRLCPFGVSRGNFPSRFDGVTLGAHQETECSSAGICSRSSGRCICTK